MTEKTKARVGRCRPVRRAQTGELIEALAALEHDQWRHWSKAVGTAVPLAVRRRWQRCWIPYARLADEVKDADRFWARKVLAVLRKRKLIPKP